MSDCPCPMLDPDTMNGSIDQIVEAVSGSIRGNAHTCLVVKAAREARKLVESRMCFDGCNCDFCREGRKVLGVLREAGII